MPDEYLLAVAILGPDKQSREAIVGVFSQFHGLRIKEFTSFPDKTIDLSWTFKSTFDIVLIDVDADRDHAFSLAKELCANGGVYVMAYSAKADMDAAVQLMRVGVREFLTLPPNPLEISTALRRAADYVAAALQQEKTAPSGKLLVFLGTKGGCGVTTLAANFALALALESDKKTLMIDLGVPLGDVAIHLGITNEYSVATALHAPDRVDANLLSTLVVKHGSGLDVLAAPLELSDTPRSAEAINKLMRVARAAYEYVVVDLGSWLDLIHSDLFDRSATVYLITQVGITELRNANCMITKYFAAREDNLQIVLNRYKSNDLLFDDNKITEVLTRPAQWKMPDDYAAARRKRETATPMVQIDSPISRSIRQMAKAALGIPAESSEKRGFFSFLR